ncbi:MAG: hypothetical protein VB064_12910 [Oscillospiraceae bacterium]|nr:hypothetical protein [Oscillospiraceae bacterium]
MPEEKIGVNSSKNKGKCFVIMPISESKDFEECHFKKIYEQIFSPAIKSAGYTPHRADDDKSSHFIQADIIKDLIEAPMALCDLSTRNPNVLYELGIRHAFNKPVVLVHQVGTDRIFDITGINTLEYRQDRLFDEVLEDRDAISKAIEETEKDSTGRHSLIKLIQVSAAKYDESAVSGDYKLDVLLNSIMNELKEIKQQSYRDSKDIINYELQKSNTILRNNEIKMKNADEILKSINAYFEQLDIISSKKILTKDDKNLIVMLVERCETIINTIGPDLPTSYLHDLYKRLDDCKFLISKCDLV